MRNLLLILLLGVVTFKGELLTASKVAVPPVYKARGIELVHKLITVKNADWLLVDHFTELSDYVRGRGTLTTDTIAGLKELVLTDIEERKRSPFVDIFSEQDLTQLFAELSKDVELELAAEEGNSKLVEKIQEQLPADQILAIDGIVDLKNARIKALESDDRLYLYQLILTLEDGREVTISKVGKSTVGYITTRVGRQITQMKKLAELINIQVKRLKANEVADDEELITFQFSKKEKALPVIKMEVKEIFTSGNTAKNESKRAKTLKNGIHDTDVHRLLIKNGYYRVAGIPNTEGGISKEMFIHIDNNGSSKDGVEQRGDIENALADANEEYYRLNRSSKQNSITNDYNGVSLHIPELNRAEVILAGIYANAGISKISAKIKKETLQQNLAKADMEIRWLKYKKIIAEKVADKVEYMWNKKLDELSQERNSLDRDAIENLSIEVYLMRVFLDGIEGKLEEAARQVGFTGENYSYEKHINGKIKFNAAKLTEMRAFTLLRYGEKEGAFDAFMNHVTQTKGLDVGKITTSSDKLIEIIKTSIGRKKLDALLKGNTRAGNFTQLLTKAALEDKPAALVKEVILMRVFLDGIEGQPREAARQVGFTGKPAYSYEAHINGKIKFNVAKLTEMRAFTLLCYGEKEEVIKAFDAFMNHVASTKGLDVKKITTASDRLIKIIKTSIGIKKLDALLKGNTRAGDFTQLLTDAALENNPVYELIKEVILMRILLDGIGVTATEAARQVGFTGKTKYSYEAHINGKIKFNVAKLTEMRAFTLLRYSEKEEVFDAFIEHVTWAKNLDVKRITTASDKLIKIIKTSIGIKKLDALLKGNTRAGDFTQLLTDAALENNPVYELIKEVIMMRVFLDGIEGAPDKAARQVGYTGHPQYNYEAHINGKIKFNVAKLTEMRAFTRLRYGEESEAAANFKNFMNHVASTKGLDVEKITTASDKLIEIIIGIEEFDKLMAGTNSGSKPFTQLLTKAALENNPVYELIKEVILMRVFLDGIEGAPDKAARQVGFTGKPAYTYEAHLRGDITFNVARLIEMRAFTLLRYGEKEEAFDAFMNHVASTKGLDVKKITTASDRLIEIIDTSIGIDAFDKLMAGTNSGPKPFTQLLPKASLEGKPVERIKKVILMRKLIAAIQTLTGERARDAASSLGVTGHPRYTYQAHLGVVDYDDSGTTEEIAKKKAEEISEEFSAKIHEALKKGGMMEGYVSELADEYRVSKDDLQQARTTLSTLTEDGESIADFEAALEKEKEELKKLLKEKKINQEDLNNKINAYAEAIKILEQKQAVDDMQAALKRLQKMDTEQPNTPKEVITPPASEKYEQIHMFDFEKVAS